jgi:hypothetical protein
MRRTNIKVFFLFVLIVIMGLNCDSKPDNKDPIALIDYNSPACVNTFIDFDASESYDPDGGSISASWRFEDNSVLNGIYVTKKFMTLESQTVWLTITDDEGTIATTSCQINISLCCLDSDCEITDGNYEYLSYSWAQGADDWWITFSSLYIPIDPSWEYYGSNAVSRAMATYHWDSGADVTLRFDPNVLNGRGVGRDQANIVTAGEIDGSGSTLAQAIIHTSNSRIVEVDIIFDNDESWSCNGETNTFDLQSVATHELGHFLGLDDLYDSGDACETLYGHTAPGDDRQRTLYCGDKRGLQNRYGSSLSRESDNQNTMLE